MYRYLFSQRLVSMGVKSDDEQQILSYWTAGSFSKTCSYSYLILSYRKGYYE